MSAFCAGKDRCAAHLHGMGLAHNGICPGNTVFDDEGRAVLIDFDVCVMLGEKTLNGRRPMGWKGLGEGREFTESSFECDQVAIWEIKKHLEVGVGVREEEGEEEGEGGVDEAG